MARFGETGSAVEWGHGFDGMHLRISNSCGEKHMHIFRLGPEACGCWRIAQGMGQMRCGCKS